MWASMTAKRTRPLVFIDDVTSDKSSRIIYEVFRTILSTYIRPNASKPTGLYLAVQVDNDLKNAAKASQDL